MRKVVLTREGLYAFAEEIELMREGLDQCLAQAYKSDSSYLMADMALTEARGALEALGEFMYEFEEDWDEAFPAKAKEQELNTGLEGSCDYFPGADLIHYSDKHGK